MIDKTLIPVLFCIMSLSADCGAGQEIFSSVDERGTPVFSGLPPDGMPASPNKVHSAPALAQGRPGSLAVAAVPAVETSENAEDAADLNVPLDH